MRSRWSTPEALALTVASVDDDDASLVVQGDGSPRMPKLRFDAAPSHPSPPAVQPPAPQDLRKCSEEALRKLLGVRDKEEMVLWLSQGWVVDIYAEYCRATIDDWRAAMETIEANGGDIPLPERRSSQKFLVNRAADALRSRNPRFTSTHVADDHWTGDDHDVRFIVRLVDEGRVSGRCWERYNRGDHTERLCAIAYRLMCWLRAMHRITNATSGSSRWYKANCDRWVAVLSNARRRRADQGDTPPTVGAIVAAQRSTSPSEFRDPGPVPVQAQLSPMPRDHTLNTPHHATSLGIPAAVAAFTPSPFHRTAPGIPLAGSPCGTGSSVPGDSDTSWHSATEGPIASVGSATFPPHDDRERVSTAFGGVFDSTRTRHGGSVDGEIPYVPEYRAIRSRKGWNQMKAIEWMTEAGKKRFDTRQDALLGRWGVSAQHDGTCVLVPASWSDLDPRDLVEDFSYGKCPPSGPDKRLSFAMSDHAATWARAASWFDSGSWPWTGAAFDNFVGIGPYRPMDGSHLCHHGACINQHHLKYEDSGINAGRNRCLYAAQDIRLSGLDVPQRCARHQPPCLLQHAALTPFEVYSIQFSIFRMANGLPPVEGVRQPSDHPYPTFEYQLPLSFADCSVNVDPSNLIVAKSQPVTSSTQVPILSCRFCTRVTTYRRITALWCHIRDKHTMINNQERLEEILRTGSYWRDHYECQRTLGHAINRSDPTWLKLEQMKKKDFSWDVVLTWKAYSAKGGV